MLEYGRRGKESLDYAQTTGEAVTYFLEEQNLLRNKRLFLKKASG